GGGHPVRSPRGSMRTGRVGWSMLWGSNPDARDGAPPFEGGASTCSAKHRDSPCLLVEGADCAGVCLAVLAWLCPGLSRDARSRVARMFTYPCSGKTTPWPSCRLHAKNPANIMYVMRRGAGRVVARYPVERPRFSPWSPCCRRFCRLALRGIIAESPSTLMRAPGARPAVLFFGGAYRPNPLQNLYGIGYFAGHERGICAVPEGVAAFHGALLPVHNALPQDIAKCLRVG